MPSSCRTFLKDLSCIGRGITLEIGMDGVIVGCSSTLVIWIAADYRQRQVGALIHVRRLYSRTAERI
jgi:hypothetical protein